MMSDETEPTLGIGAEPAASPQSTAGPTLRFSLTSRRRAAVAHGVTPAARYDPAAVLSARAHSARTSAPLVFQRKVTRTDPLGPEPPLTRYRHELAENRWQRVDTFPALHNDTKHKSQQSMFSTVTPLFHHAPAAASLPNVSSPSSLVSPVGPSFRPQTNDPLHDYLESSWLAPDLNRAKVNESLTRTQRQMFDSPSKVPTDQLPFFDQARLDARAMLEDSQRAKAARDRRKQHGRPRVSKKQQRAIATAMANAREPQLQDGLYSDSVEARVYPSSPERVLSPRTAAIPRPLLTAAATEKVALAPPPPSYLFHPQSTYFRHVPNRPARVIIQDLKRERDWNDRHQLPHDVEGW